MTTVTLAAETTNFLLPNGTIIVETVLFLVILAFFYRFIVPPLTKAMADRDEMNRKQAEERDAAVRTLAEATERYQKGLAEARAEATSIKDEARADAAQIREEMRAETDRQVAEIRQRGEDELAAQRQRALTELRGQVGDLSTQLASKILGRPIGTDGAQLATIERFLAEQAERDGRQTAGGQT